MRDKIFADQPPKYLVAAGGLTLAAQLGSAMHAARFSRGDAVCID